MVASLMIGSIYRSPIYTGEVTRTAGRDRAPAVVSSPEAGPAERCAGYAEATHADIDGWLCVEVTTSALRRRQAAAAGIGSLRNLSVTPLTSVCGEP
jgi:hypothetical protein